jgi:hypothetical protein
MYHTYASDTKAIVPYYSSMLDFDVMIGHGDRFLSFDTLYFEHLWKKQISDFLFLFHDLIFPYYGNTSNSHISHR